MGAGGKMQANQSSQSKVSAADMAKLIESKVVATDRLELRALLDQMGIGVEDSKEIIRGPIDFPKMDQKSFIARLKRTGYLDITGMAPKDTWTLFHAGTLEEAKKQAKDAAGGAELVKNTRREAWEITHSAMRSSPKAVELLEKLNACGYEAWHTVTKIIHEKTGSASFDMRADAAEDAAMAMRLIILKDLDFDAKNRLVQDYYARMEAWSAGVCVAAYINGKIIGYYSDTPLQPHASTLRNPEDYAEPML